MNAPYVKEICPTCRVEFVGPQVSNPNPQHTTKGKRCPAGHWHSLTALWNVRQKIDREKHPMPPPVKKGKPPTLRSLGFGGPHEAYQLAATYLLDGYDQAMKTAPEGTMARAIIDGAFKGRAEIARQILGAAG